MKGQNNRKYAIYSLPDVSSSDLSLHPAGYNRTTESTPSIRENQNSPARAKVLKTKLSFAVNISSSTMKMYRKKIF